MARKHLSCKFALLVCAAVLVMGLRAASAATDVPVDQKYLIPEDASLLSGSMLWDKDITLRGGLGYKDNVPLSPSAPQGSPFATAGFDLMVFRVPLDGLGVNLVVSGDDVRYWRNPEGIYKEDLFFTSAQVQKTFGEHWQAGIEVKGVYADQVVEELTQSSGVQAIEARGDTLSVRPFLRRNLGKHWWLQLEPTAAREWWQSPLDDQWKFGGQALLGFSYGHQSQVTLSYSGVHIAHDDWIADDALGNSVPEGTKLAVWRQMADLKWEHTWDTHQRWRSVTRLGFQHDADNGGGWFNYNRYLLSEELRFRSRNWEIRGTAAVYYYDFPVQTVLTPPSLTLYFSTLELSARVERRLYKELRCFAQFEHEQTTSNDPASEYKVNTATGGLSIEF